MNLQATRYTVHALSPPLSFACDPTSGCAVRRYVRDRAIVGGRPELADEAEAVAAELFANAMEAQLHQGVTTVINAQAIVAGYSMTIEVYDHAQGAPFLRDLGREWRTAEHGRGLYMVNAITRGAWRWEPWATGKVVVAVITVPIVTPARASRLPRTDSGLAERQLRSGPDSPRVRPVNPCEGR
jgi:hypothetical protein